MIARTFAKFLHTSRTFWAVEKSNLALLRKKTGYTFANCKKALELHNNDIAKAEKWLKEQAKALGWSKATKLEGRQTRQGLVGVAVNQNAAALVEVNCETDFVARNSNFQGLVSEVASTCLNFAAKQQGTNGHLTKIALDAEQLKNLKAADGNNSLSDRVALIIGSVDENATLRRGFCLKTTEPSVLLYAYAHPSGTVNGNVLLGRVAGIIALRQTAPNDEVNVDEVGRSLCQHVVGMNPKRIGSPEDDRPAEDADDEECLIYQDYLEDQTVTVREILEESGLEVVDFKRFECGEAATVQQPLESVETCQ